MEDTESTLDLAFLTDITGKLDYLNGELQDKDKIVADMMQQVQTNIFSVHLQRKRVLHFEQHAMPGSPLTYKESNTRCSQWQHDNVMVKLDLNIEKQMCSLNVLYDHF